MIDNFGLETFNPPTFGSSQDQLFSSTNPGSAAAVSTAAGMVFLHPYGGNPVANFGWSLTTIAPGTLDVIDNFPASALKDAGPVGALLLAADGNYYGTTVLGGGSEDGTGEHQGLPAG
jgi:hypothetical protein